MAEQFTAVEPDRPGGEALPTGTVTFLFTDIVGSTRLLREDRQAYAAALADHRRLLRAAFAAQGGREVDTSGDAFFVAFPTAGQAVAGAAQAQRSLAAQPWPDAARVLVRMGLHSGEATLAGGSYVGLAVHRAARIAAAAHGGQVLLSDTTAALVGDQMPAGTALRRLGEHRLRDFLQPAPLFQLDIPGLPTEFPPPRTLPRHRPLPASAGELLGRDDDAAGLVALLRDPRTRLVTVTGLGGIGKTRLALQAARAVASDFPGGAVFVPLSALVDPALVLSTLADAVGAGQEAGVELLDTVRTALGEDRTLLVIDNFEQVVDAAADLARLLDTVPTAVALVTSRVALRLRAERLFPLAPLAMTAAVALFAERAAGVRPGFVVDAANAAVVAEICRRLNGLPLAIELAAARTRLLPPAALLERLGHRIDVLAGGPVDLPERQRTLRATMEWSFGLLRSHEQSLFTRLAVFSGGWTLAAAETVCSRPGEPDVLDDLSALIDASLLTESDTSAPEPRSDMLETVRTYALEKLAASPDRSETERRHTEWVLATVDPLVHPDARGFREALERFDRERANVRGAVQRAVDAADAEAAALLIRHIFPYLLVRDAFREARGWLDQILPRAADAPAAVRGRLLVLRAAVADVSVEARAMHPLLAEGRQLLPDDTDHAFDHGLAAVAGLFLAVAEGSIGEAADCMEEAAARFTPLGWELAGVFESMFRGNLALLRQDLESAARHYEAALELAGRLGDDAMVGQYLSLLGWVRLAQGDAARARRSILDGAAANRRAGQPTGIAHSLEGLAAVAMLDGRPEVAARALAAAAAAREIVAMPPNPVLPPLVDDLTRRSRERLGEQAFDVACAEGRRWPLLQALDRTLEELPDGGRRARPSAPAGHGTGAGGG